MLGLLIAGSILLLAGAGVLAWMRATPERALPPVSQAPRSVFSLQVGDIVQHTGTDYTVDSTIRYEEEGMTWQAHLLGGGERDLWLVVEEDDRVVITLVEEVDAAGEELPTSIVEKKKRVVFRGMTFKLRESGTASATRTLPGSGQTQNVRCGYLDYDSPDGQVLYVEFWPPNDREVSYGRVVTPGSLTILPGS
jgi:hypothetical protein